MNQPTHGPAGLKYYPAKRTRAPECNVFGALIVIVLVGLRAAADSAHGQPTSISITRSSWPPSQTRSIDPHAQTP